MGFMNVLNFSAAIFDLLGWPLIALGYPLCASIWVIETNSITGIRKLVTYWVLFSLISLFEHAFSKLPEWIPFWPYIKLMVICRLVIPYFDGSYYVYQHLVHPCLSMAPQVVMNWHFNESNKLFYSGENFLVVADRYIKENGAEALEKLLASKLKGTKPNVEVKEIRAPAALEEKGEQQWRCQEPNVAQKEIQVVEVTGIKNGDGAKRVQQTEINLGETKSNTTCAAGIKERTTALVAAEIEACRDNRTPEIPLHKKVQKEWACAVCQVTTQSEATLNSHLQGKRHKATSKQLKAKNQATKTNGQKCASSNGPNQKKNKRQEEKVRVSETNEQGYQKNSKQSVSGMKELGSWCNICNVSCTSELDMASHLNGGRHFNRIKQLSELWCSNCNVKCSSEDEMASHRRSKRHLEQLKERSGLWCSICSVNCNSEVDMDSHLKGRRHLDQIEEQLRLWCGACNVFCKSEINMASHLHGKRHLEKTNI